MDPKIGKRAFKLFKTNMFTVQEVAQMLNVNEKTLEKEFRSWCGDKFIYPGVYLVGGWVDKIVEAVEKWGRVVVVGDEGTGKTINAFHAAKKIAKNIGNAHSLIELDQMITARHPGVILADDVDLMGAKHKTILEKASLIKNLRVIATSTKDIVVSGFNIVRIKAPTGDEMKELADVKGWKMIPGTRNLVDLMKANVYEGGVLDAETTSALLEVKNVLLGKGSGDVDKLVIEQVVRNGYEMDHGPAKIEEMAKASVGSWLSFMHGVDPSQSLSTIKKTSGASTIMYRKGILDV